jgi:putative membrane fusion protein
MNTKATMIISWIIGIFFIIYVGYQAYLFFYSPYKTETVFEYTVSEDVGTKGIISRDETIITSNNDGVISYIYENGSKVAKDIDICILYNDRQDIINSSKLEKIQNEINALNEAVELSKTGIGQPDILLNQISEKHQEILNIVETTNLKDVNNLKNQLLSLISKRQVIIDKDVDLTTTINHLNQEKADLSTKVSPKKSTIKTPKSGYFVDHIDGFEEIVNNSVIMDYSVKQVEDTIKKNIKPKTDNVVGKVITSYDWKYTTTVDAKTIEKMKIGSKVAIIFSTMPNNEIDATIEKINFNKGEAKGVVVFSSDYMSSDISKLRMVSAQIRLSKNTGLKIPKQALRSNEGKKGVYIMLGTEIIFKEVEIIYEEEKFFLSKVKNYNEEEKTKYLQSFDDIIVKGKGLYEKKSNK